MAATLGLVRLARRAPRLTTCLTTRHCLPSSAVPVLSTNFATSSTVATAKVGSGGKHWKYERVATVALLGLIPMGCVYPNPVVDYGLAVLLPLHGHWGFESIIEDYTAQSLKKLAFILLYGVSIGTFAGLMYLNVKDVGICKAVQILWALK